MHKQVIVTEDILEMEIYKSVYFHLKYSQRDCKNSSIPGLTGTLQKPKEVNDRHLKVFLFRKFLS